MGWGAQIPGGFSPEVGKNDERGGVFERDKSSFDDCGKLIDQKVRWVQLAAQPLLVVRTRRQARVSPRRPRG